MLLELTQGPLSSHSKINTLKPKVTQTSDSSNITLQTGMFQL